MKRLLALDVGDKRIGFAVSDELGITAQGVETFTRTGSQRKDVSHVVQLANRYKPVKLIFGMPRNMDGSYGFQSEKVRAFAEAVLKKLDAEYDFYDERLTTVSAKRVLCKAELNWKEQRKIVDKLAAVIILQGYMDSHPNG